MFFVNCIPSVQPPEYPKCHCVCLELPKRKHLLHQEQPSPSGEAEASGFRTDSSAAGRGLGLKGLAERIKYLRSAEIEELVKCEESN